jgi:serine/threonine protein kinase
VIGETIGHFEIIARAGRGGMGEVFVAEHTTIKTRVAIKVLHAQVSANTDSVQRFFNEARAVARIQHAGIAKIYDVGFHTNQRAYLIMEYLEGETLAGRLRRTKRISARHSTEIARQIASILDATHHAGIIHRDLKPENVFLVRDRELPSGERVRLLDFGIAKLADTVASSPTTVGAIGTPTYMAPEQWSDSSRVDWRADVYSLGCIVYEMVAGRPPFASTSIAEACAKHLHETPQPIRAFVPDVPIAVDTLTLRLLAKDPALRVPSIHVLEQQLAELGAAAPAGSDEALPYDPVATTLAPITTLSSAASMTTPTPPPPRRRRTAVALAGLGVAAIGAVVGWSLLPSSDEPARPATPTAPAPMVVPGSPPPAAPPDAQAATEREPALVAWLEAANPFVAWRGGQWLAHQVTRREYRQFLESLPVSAALRYQPVTGWDDRDPMRPVAWVTYERAAAFCRAIHAALPTSDQWQAASRGAWGLDPAGAGRPGPLQEWTSTVREGFVVVRGGHERMSPDERDAAAGNPLMKSSEGQAGASPPVNVVASETIGFRCVR